MSDLCSICKKAVIDGAEIHGLTGNHWACVYPNGHESLEQIIERGDRALAGLTGKPYRKPRAREGEGPGALKCKEWARLALEDLFDAPVTITAMWNQQGAYRGPRWDLDVWGLFFVVGDSNLKNSASSLSRMSEHLKARGTVATRHIDGMISLDPK